MTTREAIDARRVQALEAQLATGRKRLADLTAQTEQITARADARHWTETDSAIGSGIRRKSNARADTARFNRYDREAETFVAHVAAVKHVTGLEVSLLAAVAERDRVRLTRDDVMGAKYVCTKFGWYSVVKVNRLTVSVSTGFLWLDRIPLEDILAISKVTRDD